MSTEQGARRSSFTYEELLACGRGELFGMGNAQLPMPPMLMFDRITEVSETGGANGKGHIQAELDVKPDLWFFPCHFKGDPVMPGCLGLDALWQLTGFYLGWLGLPGRGRALGADEWISHPISLALAQSRPISPGALHEGLLERRGGAQPLLWLEFEEPP